MQTILLISHCTTSAIFFPNPSPHCTALAIFFQSLHLFYFFGSSISSPYIFSSSNHSSPLFTFLLSIIPHLIVTIPPTLPLPFWLFFFSPSSFLSHLSVFQPFPSSFGSSSPHFFFLSKFFITSYTHLSFIRFIFCLQKRWFFFFFLLLFLFFKYFLQLCSWFMSFCVFDSLTLGWCVLVFLVLCFWFPSHVLSPPLMALPKWKLFSV